MRNWKKRFLALALSAVMAMGLLPGTAYAAVGELVGNSPRQNEALLDALTELAGPEDAREFYDLLQEYGLLDKNGEPVTDRTIDLDGERYTLKEVEALLDDPDTDLSRVAEVDEVPITLGDLATVIAIEREIQYLQKHYFSGRTFEDEALDNVNSLLNQLQTQGLTLSATPRAAEQVVLGETGEQSTGLGYPIYYISGMADFEVGDTFSVKFKLAIPDSIQKLARSAPIVVGFSNDLDDLKNYLASESITIEDAIKDPDAEYTLTYTVPQDWRPASSNLYLTVAYQSGTPPADYSALSNFSDNSFGDLYGGVSFYEPEGFLFQEGNSLEENWNCFFDMTLSHPELFQRWTKTGPVENPQGIDEGVNTNGSFSITRTSSSDGYENLNYILQYLNGCIADDGSIEDKCGPTQGHRSRFTTASPCG